VPHEKIDTIVSDSDDDEDDDDYDPDASESALSDAGSEEGSEAESADSQGGDGDDSNQSSDEEDDDGSSDDDSDYASESGLEELEGDILPSEGVSGPRKRSIQSVSTSSGNNISSDSEKLNIDTSNIKSEYSCGSDVTPAAEKMQAVGTPEEVKRLRVCQ
jgi:hypothetical protein